MAEGTTTVEEPSLLNEPVKEMPVKTPEGTLFPDTGSEQKPGESPKKEEPAKLEEPKKEEPASPIEAKKEEPKAEPSKPSPDAKTAPVDYENLKLPEGSLLSNEELAVVKKEAKEQGLTLEEVNGVLEVKNDAVKAFQTRQNEAFVKTRQEWKASWTKDPEYGGEKLAENTELAKRAWDRLADSELKKLADLTGFGDHPAVLRMMTRIGRLFSEDQLVRGSVGGPPRQKSAEEILYGGTTPGPQEPMS